MTGELSAFLHKTILNDTRIGAPRPRHGRDALSGALPDARTFLVTSQFPDGVRRDSPARFVVGRYSGLLRSSRLGERNCSTRHRANSVDNRHRYRPDPRRAARRALTQTRIRKHLGVHLWIARRHPRQSSRGRSLRSFVSGEIAPRVETGSAALGDYRRASDRLQLQYGLRLDANQVATAGIQPGRLDLWPAHRLRATRGAGEPTRSDSAMASATTRHDGCIPASGARGGTSSPAASANSGMTFGPGSRRPSRTGLPNGIQQDRASEVPCRRQFPGYVTSVDSIPKCAGGAARLVNTLPNVTTIARGVQSWRSWRGNLNLRGPFVTPSCSLQRRRGQPLAQSASASPGKASTLLRRSAGGAISTEGNRPLYVSNPEHRYRRHRCGHRLRLSPRFERQSLRR